MKLRFWKKGGTPAAAAVDADVAYARRLYMGVLAFATIVSVVGNVFFAVQSAYIAVRTGGPVEMTPVASGVAHAIPPVLLLLIAEVWAVSMRVMPGQRGQRRGNRLTSWFLVGNQAWSQRAVFAIMLASFALSAQALFMIGVWTHVPPSLAWLTPVMVDLTIVVCADKLWALSRSVRDRVVERVVQPVDDPVGPVSSTSSSSVGQSPTSRPTTPVDDLASYLSTPVEQTPTTDPTTDPTTSVDGPTSSLDEFVDAPADEFVDAPADEFVDAPADEFVDAPADEFVDAPADELSTTPTTYGRHRDDQVVPAVDEFVDELDGLLDGVVDESPTTPTRSPSTSSSTATDLGVDDLDDDGIWRRRASELLASTSLTATVDEVATVLSLHDRGESKQAIANTLKRSRSTITGWIKAWEELALVTAGAGND